MKRQLALALAAYAALAAPIAVASAESDYFRAYQRASDGMLAKECKAHLAKASELAESPLLTTTISQQGQAAFLEALIECAYAEGDKAVAFRAAQIWHGIDPGNTWVEAVRLILGAGEKQPQVTVDAFNALVRTAPQYLRTLELRNIWIVINAAEELENADERKFELHQALLRIGYVPPPPERDEHLRFDHAELLVARGDLETAKARLSGVTDLSLLARLRIERRFDVLRGASDYETKLDLLAAAERNVAAARKLVEERPDVLAMVADHVEALHVARRPEEALAVADAAIARHAANVGAYKDADDQMRWLLNRRGYLLYDLGRIAEAHTSLAGGAGLAEHGTPNVSNIINYMMMLVDEGAAREAAELLPKIGRASPYGQAWIESGRVCLGVMLEDAEMQESGLAWLREHEKDNSAAYSRGLLCANALDESAALFVRRLADPWARGEALLALQDYENPADEHLPFLRTLRKRLAIVRARPEVQTAIDAVGRIEKIPVHISAGDI